MGISWCLVLIIRDIIVLEVLYFHKGNNQIHSNFSLLEIALPFYRKLEGMTVKHNRLTELYQCD